MGLAEAELVHTVVPAWLVDAVTEATILELPDAAGRATVICELVEEMCASVSWLNDERSAGYESRSLTALLQEARAHLFRMMAIAQNQDEPGSDS